jgi:spore photoproduct lyase
MIKPITRKSMIIRESNRSSDFISPSFGFGCLLECTYCYMKRHRPKGLQYATNTNQILDEINSHALFTSVEKPNQTHRHYITYDISCNEDFALHSKYYDWQNIFGFFKDHNKAMATLATKIIPNNFLEYNPNEKVRIRFSMMPQSLSSVLEPNTAKIIDRIKAVNTFRNAGYDVHLNFSPVVYYKNWIKEYRELFKTIDDIVEDKENVLSEVIFLTHNVKKHQYNLDNNVGDESLLWQPEIQEAKESQYGGHNIRYKYGIKREMIELFKINHKKIIPWNTIRYIF